MKAVNEFCTDGPGGFMVWSIVLVIVMCFAGNRCENNAAPIRERFMVECVKHHEPLTCKAGQP